MEINKCCRSPGAPCALPCLSPSEAAEGAAGGIIRCGARGGGIQTPKPRLRHASDIFIRQDTFLGEIKKEAVLKKRPESQQATWEGTQRWSA